MYRGGNAWESNPPEKLLTPHTGFEDQRAHQHSFTPTSQLFYHTFGIKYNLSLIFENLFFYTKTL